MHNHTWWSCINNKKEPGVTVRTKSIPGRENSKCKGPEMGVSLAGLANPKAPGLENSYQGED